MFRVYFVKETEYGLEVGGPNGHKWVCKSDDTWSRATGFAKALERAYLEGQKSITLDVELAIALDSLAELGNNLQTMNADALRAKVQSLAAKTSKVKHKMDSIRALNQKHESAPTGEEGDEGQASVKDDRRTPLRLVVRRSDPGRV